MTVEIVHYGVRSLHLFEITDETTPTYATGEQAKCVRNVGFAKRISEAILEGDDTICYAGSQTKGLDFTLEFGGVPLQHMELLEGATLTEIAGPPAASHLNVTVEDNPGDFGLIAVVLGKKGGNAHVALHNCRVTSGGLPGAQMDTFGMLSYGGVAMPSASNAKTLYGIRHFSTAASISTTWATNLVTAVAP